MVFIFYIVCVLDDIILYLYLNLLLIFGMIKYIYFEGCFDKVMVKIILG